MALPCYLAMTAAEMDVISELPPQVAWMACHFSQSYNGLSNLPTELPPDSMIILDDSIPICQHNPYIILEQLNTLCVKLNPKAVLLDFQRPANDEYASLVSLLAKDLPYPLIVTEAYQHKTSCPILLPPVPHDIRIEDYIEPWKEKQIWLEAALGSMVLKITENGCTWEQVPHFPSRNLQLSSNELYCHYQTEITDREITVTMHRTIEDLQELINKAESLGICGFIGLFQELGPQFQKKRARFF